MIWDNREMIDDSDFPATIYELLKYLVKEEHFEDSVIFERPRFRHKDDVESSLESLEWAAKNRKIWFMGPFDWIRFRRETGPLEGSLFTGENAMVFKTLIRVDEVENLLPLFEQQEFEADVQETGHFTTELSVWVDKPFSLQSVKEFIAKLKVVLAKRKLKPPR